MMTNHFFINLILTYKFKNKISSATGEIMVLGTSAWARGDPMEDTRLEHMEAGVDHVDGLGGGGGGGVSLPLLGHVRCNQRQTRVQANEEPFVVASGRDRRSDIEGGWRIHELVIWLMS